MRKPPKRGPFFQVSIHRAEPKFMTIPFARVALLKKSRNPNPFVHGGAFSFLTARGGGLAIKSNLGVPLIVKDEVHGILGFYTKVAHDFTEAELDLLLTVAGQAAIAINHARLYDEIAIAKR